MGRMDGDVVNEKSFVGNGKNDYSNDDPIAFGDDRVMVRITSA
jgi:hypothetical protein